MAAIGIYIKLNIDLILKKGLIAYLPYQIIRVFTSRSIFDILCDIWFIPKVSIYAKAVVLPFFYKITPEEAIFQLNDLHPQVRRALLTKVDLNITLKILMFKGIINLFPSQIRNLILPAEIQQPNKEQEEQEEFKSDSEYNENEIEPTKRVSTKSIEASFSKDLPSEQAIKNTVEEILCDESSEQEHYQEEEKNILLINSIVSIDQNRSLALINQSEVDSPISKIKNNDDEWSSKEKNSMSLWSTDDDNLKQSTKFQAKNILPSCYDMNILQNRVEIHEEGKSHKFS